MTLFIVGLIVFLINLPCGYWRSKVKRFSLKWFLAIHISIPIVYSIRIYEGIGWEVTSFVVLVGAYFLGQFIGSRYLSIFINKIRET
jgi:hypothetical protein